MKRALLMLVLISACTSEDDGNGATPAALTMDDFAGVWVQTSQTTLSNRCPFEFGDTNGFYLIVTEADDDSGTAKVCANATGTADCFADGPVSISGGKARHTASDTYSPYADLDCNYEFRASGEWSREGDALIAEPTFTVPSVEGTECAELEAAMQEETQTDYELLGCEVSSRHEFEKPATPPGWDCVGTVEWPPAPAASLDVEFHYYHVGAVFGDPEDWAPFEGLLIEVCEEGSDCVAPIDSGETNADGRVVLTLPTPGPGFEGYLRGSGADLVTFTQEFLPPIQDSTSRWLSSDYTPVVFTEEAFPIFADTVAAVAPDDGLGSIMTSTIDCDGVDRPDVRVTVNGLAADDHAGSGSTFFNIAPGEVEIVGTLEATGEVVARVRSSVRAGELTTVHFGPTPL